MENEVKDVAVVDPRKAWTAEQIETIKKTVAVGANDSELMMFLSLAAKYKLDPFAKEIWCVQMGGRMTIITARDGYLKIANCNPQFDGFKSDIVCANDKFTTCKTEVRLSGLMRLDIGKTVSIPCMSLHHTGNMLNPLRHGDSTPQQ